MPDLVALGFSPTVAARLSRKLIRNPNGCLEWTGAHLESGHGRMSRGSRTAGYESTHRIAWIIEHGPIPEGLMICHRCDNPSCCEITHLFLGTAADNSHDMMTKHRGRRQIPAGEAHPDARLTDEDIARMRRDYPAIGSYAELGRRYGITKQHARNVILGTKRRTT